MPISRVRLIAPPLVPLSIAAIGFFAEKMGHQWNVHGDAIGMILLFAVSGAVALVMSIMALAKTVPELRSAPEQRTPVNFLCAGFAAIFVVAALACIASAVTAIVRS